MGKALYCGRSQADRGESFRIVFWGEAARGYSRAQVARQFVRLFRIRNRQQLARLFSGKTVTLKRSLSTAEAHRYITAIQDAGGICRMESDREWEADSRESYRAGAEQA